MHETCSWWRANVCMKWEHVTHVWKNWERRNYSGRILIFIIRLVKILTYFHERRYLTSNECTLNKSETFAPNSSLSQGRVLSPYLVWRSGNYPARNACGWKKYHFPSPAKTRRVEWRFYGLKYREMIQPVRVSVAENEKRKDIRATIIHPIAV